jgi:hypothetical protein
MNGSGWRSEKDFYDALANALGSVEWHGRNAAAFQETMIYYLDLNTVQPPYEVIVRDADDTLRPFLEDFASWIEQARKSRRDDPEWGDDVDVKVLIR